MKIAVAQIQSLKADVLGNIARHAHFIELASARQVKLIVFPELSLTGYNPLIANDVATTVDDNRFLSLQKLSDARHVTFCVGVPVASEKGPVISMLIFQPGQAVQVYAKRHLHADEAHFFAPGHSQPTLSSPDGKIAFAICYEISVPPHAEAAHSGGAAIYVASVAKTRAGVSEAAKRLGAIAKQYAMNVFMSNCVGECENSPAGGQSAIWNAQGVSLASLNDREEGFVAYDSSIPQMPAETVRC